MSSAARFLLEFEATGDQEVVNKIKEVGAAGKETAADLQELQGIEDPFAPIAEGAEAAVAPIEGVGTAAEEAVTPITDMGVAAEEGVTGLTDVGSAADSAVTPIEGVGTATEDLGGIFSGAGTEVETFSGTMDAVGGSADAATGGLSGANTMVGDFGEAASTSADKTGDFGGSLQGITGSITAVGGTIGGLISLLFTYQDAQIRVQKAQLGAAKAAEAYRKAEAAVDKLLATATSNQDAIAAARQRVADALARVNELMKAGITSGAEFEAAQKELAAAQADLAVQAGKGGVAVDKVTSALEKEEGAMGRNKLAADKADKANRELMTTMIGMASQAAGIGGSLVQMAQGAGRMREAATKLVAKLGGKAGLVGTLAAVGAAALGVYEAFKAIEALPSMVNLAEQLKTGDIDKVQTAWGAYVDKVKQVPGVNLVLGGALDDVSNKLATASKESETLNRIFPTLSSGAKSAEEGVTNLSGGTKKLGSNMTLSTHQAAELANMIGQNKDVQDQLTGSEAKAAPVIGELVTKRILLGAALAESIQKYQEANRLTEAQQQALNAVIDPTVKLNDQLMRQTEIIGKLTTEDAKSIAAVEERNRAMIIANSGVNNAIVAEIQYQQALTAMTASMVKDTDEKNANAKATLALVDSEENAQNAIATVNEEYANSVDRLADLNTVLDDSKAAHTAMATAVNENLASLKEEEIALGAAIISTGHLETQSQALTNARHEGELAAREWLTALDENAAAEEAEISLLKEVADVFGGLPSYIEPTIENYQAFIQANKDGGAAMLDFKSTAIDAWNELTSAADEFTNKLIESFRKGGEEGKEAFTKAMEELPAAVKATLSPEEMGLLELDAEFAAAGQNAAEAFASNMRANRSMPDAGFQAGVDAASQIIEGFVQQHPEFADEAQIFFDAVDTGSAQAVQKALATLSQMPGPVGEIFGKMKDAADTNLDGIPDILQKDVIDPLTGLAVPASAAGGQAGSAFVSEWDANVQLAGNALQSIVKTASTLRVEIPITANVQQAGAALASIVKTGSTLKVQIPVTADVSAAHQAIAALVTKQQTATITYNIVTKGTPPIAKPITTTITYNYKITGKPPSVKPIKAFISYAYRITNKIPNPKEIKRFISYAYRITNKIPNPPEIKRWITYKYRVTGSRPNPSDINRWITYRYRTVGSRPAQFGMHETLGSDTMIAAHKGERVDITPGGTGGGGSTQTVGSGGGGSSVRAIGEVVIPVTLMLDNKTLIRTVRRGLVEEVSGAM